MIEDRAARIILVILILLSSAQHVMAQPEQNPLTFVQAGKWPEARMAAARTGDPVAEKLITYYQILTPNAASATDVAAFIRQAPDWPLPGLLERRRQEAIAAEPDNTIAASLCVEKKPASSPARGPALLRCADALANIGRAREADALAREAWISAISDPVTEAAFIRRFPNLLSAADQWDRFQRLAWDDAAGAQRQIAMLDPAHAAMASARLALKTNGIGYTSRPENEPGAMLDLARAYRGLDQNQAAVALWKAWGPAAQKAAPEHLDSFWSERHQLTRKLLHDGDPQGAYDVISGHGQTQPAVVAEAEFLAGFIALRRLNDPAAAARHFRALAAASPAVLTQSRAYYWLGRAEAVSGGNARADYARAAVWPMTFYGQLAARADGQSDAALVHALRAAPTPAPGLPATPSMTELAHVARLLVAWHDPRRARLFLLRMEELTRTPAERIAVGDYAAAMGLPDVAVLITRRLGRDGIVPPMQGWPIPVEPPPVPEPAVSLAIMRQESNFDVSIVSPSGARGLMQLMPATARLVARRLGEPTSDTRLTTDPGHNMRMGTAYLLDVLQQFGNSVPLAAAAYNAGPHRVTQWLADNGDPRGAISSGAISSGASSSGAISSGGNSPGANPLGANPPGTNPLGTNTAAANSPAGTSTGSDPRQAGPDMIDWIEMIPFNETRNYVQRVLENVVVYQARRSGTLPAAIVQWSR
jgi:soluble lytic murein transglycosylase